MKVRSGFVTNSSSTSYILVGKRVRTSEDLIVGGEYIVVGKWFNEGSDVFDLTDEMIIHLVGSDKLAAFLSKYNVYTKGFFAFCEDKIRFITENDPFREAVANPEFNVIAIGNADYYNSTDNIDEFLYNYL